MYLNQNLHEYMRAGKICSFLSWAVSTKILKGPFGVRTAIKSERNKY